MVHIQEVTKKDVYKKPKHEVDEIIKKAKKEYEKPVKGRFEFTEAKGGEFSFTDRQWPGMPIMIYTIKHDEICIIPYGVAKRLNNTYQKVRKFNHQIGETGTVRGMPPTFDTFSRVKFIPEEFL